MILVTGATGSVGKEPVPMLLERCEQVRVLTRDQHKVAHPKGEVECSDGDLAQPIALAGAFDGVDRA